MFAASQATYKLFFAISIKCGCSNGETSILRSEINYSFFLDKSFALSYAKKYHFRGNLLPFARDAPAALHFFVNKMLHKKFLYE